MGAEKYESVSYQSDYGDEKPHLSIVEALESESGLLVNPKFNFLSILFMVSLSITAFRLMNSAYMTLNSLFSPDVIASLVATYNPAYQYVVFYAFCFEITLSATFSLLFLYNFYSASKKKKSIKRTFLITQATYIFLITTYNLAVGYLIGSKFQTGLIVSNLIYLGIWYSFLNYSRRAKTVFVR